MTTLMQRHGPYIPFEKPIPTPISAADDTPLMSICFNQQWLPMVIGALKVLTRPETWVGTDAHIRSTIASAQNILAMYGNGCSPLTRIPNWYPSLTLDHGNFDSDAWFNPDYGNYPDGTPWARYDLPVWPDAILNPDVTVTFKARSDDSLVGGDVEYIRITHESDPAGHAFTLSVIDCLDADTEISDFTPYTLYGQFKNFRFIAGGEGTYWIKISIDGDWLCGGI